MPRPVSISDELAELVRSLRSLWAIELLLLLYREPERSHTIDDLVRELRSNAQLVGDVVFHVQEFADEEVLQSLGIKDPFELTGLYDGIDLADRTIGDPPATQSRVYLYRRPILDEWAERGDVALAELVEHVLIHEIGHHFGLSDEEIEAIEAAAR